MAGVAKVLHFPLGGVSRALSVRDGTRPAENSAYAAPFAMNVRSAGPFAERLRGGSRPAELPLRAPSAGGISAVYRDRLFVADGSTWIASRTGAHADFDLGADGADVTRPVAGNASFAGRPGEEITAVFPAGDDYLVFATATSTWVLRGEPTTGQFRLVSPNFGCVSQDAWAWDGRRCRVLSARGLFAFSPDEPPVCESSAIPRAFEAVSTATLTWDAEREAVHCVTDRGCWTYETDAKAWWPFDPASSASRVAIGPFRTSARDDADGMLDVLSVTVAAGSAAVAVAVHSGRTPEEALAAAEAGEGAWTCEVGAGFNAVVRPRRRGAWCVVVLSSTGAWAFESATATCKQLGRLRP